MSAGNQMLRKIRNPSWRNTGRSGEHPDFYAQPEEEDDEAVWEKLIGDYLYWFGDDTDAGRERLRATIENSLP